MRGNCIAIDEAISGYLTRLPRSLGRHCCVDTDVIPAEARIYRVTPWLDHGVQLKNTSIFYCFYGSRGQATG
ncbi:hypothetical protein [Rickettsia sp.]|uniref:hypothetical protein n=1 Tax=Rickettsia sp. TaxID=789 RepID=UPI00397DF417